MEAKGNQGYILIQFQLEKATGGFISIDKMYGCSLYSTALERRKKKFFSLITMPYGLAELLLKDSGHTDVYFSAVNFHGFYREGPIPNERTLTGGFTKRKSDFTTVNHYKIPGFNNPYLMGRVLGSPIDLGTSRKYTVFAEGNKVFQCLSRSRRQ